MRRLFAVAAHHHDQFAFKPFRQIAPKSFTRQDDGGYSYVFKQPQTSEEIALAEEARSSCPTETIGNDGE